MGSKKKNIEQDSIEEDCVCVTVRKDYKTEGIRIQGIIFRKGLVSRVPIGILDDPRADALEIV